MSKVLHIIYDTSMSLGHQGLQEIMKKKRLQPGFAIFINKRWSALKMLTPHNTLLHYKSPTPSRPIEPKTIKYLPHFVGANNELQYDKALEAHLIEKHERLIR